MTFEMRTITSDASLGSFNSSLTPELMVVSSACLCCNPLSRTDGNLRSRFERFRIVEGSLKLCMLKLSQPSYDSVVNGTLKSPDYERQWTSRVARGTSVRTVNH